LGTPPEVFFLDCSGNHFKNFYETH